MAAPSWPAALPIRIEAASYGVRRDGGVIESPVDRGRPKTRRRFDDVVVRRRVTLRFEASEMDDWETFLDTGIAGGALPFSWPHPERGGATETVRIEVPDGGVRHRQANRSAGQAMAFEVTLDLEVQP